MNEIDDLDIKAEIDEISKKNRFDRAEDRTVGPRQARAGKISELKILIMCRKQATWNPIPSVTNKEGLWH